MSNLVSITHQLTNIPSLLILGKTQTEGASDFRIYVQSLIKENCRNFRTSDAINMKLGQITKLDKRNKKSSNDFGGDVISANQDVIVIFPIYCQFGVIRKLDSAQSVKLTYSIIVAFYLAKTGNRTKKSLTQLLHYSLE